MVQSLLLTRSEPQVGLSAELSSEKRKKGGNEKKEFKEDDGDQRVCGESSHCELMKTRHRSGVKPTATPTSVHCDLLLMSLCV